MGWIYGIIWFHYCHAYLFCFFEGYTHFHILKKGEEIEISCETCQWEAEVNADDRSDCNFLNNHSYSVLPCPAPKEALCKELLGRTSNSCQLIVKRGFYACVSVPKFEFKDHDCFIQPFKPSAHHVESFLVAEEDPNSMYSR